jgi:hypothetical protein
MVAAARKLAEHSSRARERQLDLNENFKLEAKQSKFRSELGMRAAARAGNR